MVKSWFGGVLSGAVAMALLGACGDASPARKDTPPEEDPNPPVYLPPVMTCIPGQSCSCSGAQTGTTTCEGGVSACSCMACAPLQTHQAPVVTSCGGEPFGTWQLTKMDLGVTPLQLSRGGSVLGSCDTMVELKGDVPRVLMTLEDGGSARYFAEGAPSTQSWSERCVTSKIPEFSCGSSAWTGVYNCKVDCDTCRCDSSLDANTDDSGSWQRTAETLVLAPSGNAVTLDYCVEGNLLKLSSTGTYLEFERVHTVSNPAPCAGRTAETCISGEGCSLGACIGAPSCTSAGSEGTCLTQQGCSWDAAQCRGQAQQTCGLADFGVVPGCDFSEQEMTCAGTTKPCAQLDVGTCEQQKGCTLNETGRCKGPTLPCEDFFSCPIGMCQFIGSQCVGSTSCSSFSGEESCAYTSEIYADGICTWEASWCAGSPQPCAMYSQQECATVPGCQLMAAPP